MSIYTVSKGTLTYSSPEKLEEAVAPLRTQGWLNENNQITPNDDEEFALDGQSCIDGNTLYLPQEFYLNIHRVIDDLIDDAEKGTFLSYCDDGDLWITGWQDGQWQCAGDSEEIASYLTTDKDKDYILLDDEEFEAKYKGQDKWDEHSYVLEKASEAFENHHFN